VITLDRSSFQPDAERFGCYPKFGLTYNDAGTSPTCTTVTKTLTVAGFGKVEANQIITVQANLKIGTGSSDALRIET
jgi:hypothetical protein